MPILVRLHHGPKDGESISFENPKTFLLFPCYENHRAQMDRPRRTVTWNECYELDELDDKGVAHYSYVGKFHELQVTG